MSVKAEDAVVQGLFARIAGGYDFLNSLLSFGLDTVWRKRLVDSVGPCPPKGTGRILDLAAGTLEVSTRLAREYPAHTVIAVDFCLPMLRQGQAKLKKPEYRHIFPLAGDGRHLPLPDASVDAATIAFGLRNIRPRKEVYAEALRVLAPGGKLCILEFGSAHDRILFGLYNVYLARILPALGRLFSRDKEAYRYLSESVEAYPAAAVLADEMREAGFASVSYQRYTGGIVWLHTGEKNV